MVVAGDIDVRPIDKLELVVVAEDTDDHLGDKLDWRKAKTPLVCRSKWAEGCEISLERKARSAIEIFTQFADHRWADVFGLPPVICPIIRRIETKLMTPRPVVVVVEMLKVSVLVTIDVDILETSDVAVDGVSNFARECLVDLGAEL